MESGMHVGMLVGALMIMMMLLPMCCCKLSDEQYRKIMERHERITKMGRNPNPEPKNLQTKIE